MKMLWNRINGLNINEKSKSDLYLFLFTMICFAAGAAAWLLAGRFVLPGIEWLLGFMGYSGIVIGFFGGMIYLYNHAY